MIEPRALVLIAACTVLWATACNDEFRATDDSEESDEEDTGEGDPCLEGAEGEPSSEICESIADDDQADDSE